MEEKTPQPEKIYDALGGDIVKEIAQYPIENLGLLTTENAGKKTYNRCTENIYRLLLNHPEYKGKLRYDEWTQRQEIKMAHRWREIDDIDYTPIQRNISTMYASFRNVNKEMVIDAIQDACRAHSFDRAIDFVRKEPWDGVERLDTWVSVVYGTPDDAYHRAVGSNFFKGMAKRIIQPGCKFDSVLILEGKQGCGKSTSLSIIGGKWHLETTMRADKTDFFMQFRGKLIVEFSEGETLSRTETKNMKAMISTQTDTYRAPYGRMMKDIPRRCVFAMSTNQDEYLKDESGNRRFYPVEVNGMVNVDWLREHRQQLFAEALYRVETLKESVHEYPKEAMEMQASKMVRSSFEDSIDDWLSKPIGPTGVAMNIEEYGITIMDVWRYALNGDKAKIRKSEEMQVSLALRQLGFERRRTMIDGVQKWRWFKEKMSCR